MLVFAGKIQQLQAAWHLDRVCKTRGCEFIINTSDNLCGLLAASLPVMVLAKHLPDAFVYHPHTRCCESVLTGAVHPESCAC